MTSDDNIDYNELVTTNDGDFGSQIRSMRVYDGREEYVTIRLSEFVDAVICEHDYGDGRLPQRGIFIPFRINDIFVSPKKNVMVTFRKTLAQVPSRKHTSILTQVLASDVVAERRGMGYGTPIIGTARPVTWKDKKNYNNMGNIRNGGGGAEYAED